MKAFFVEYGKLIITGALTVTGLMFSTPFAEAVTGSVANFTSRFSEKNEESMEHVSIGLDGSGSSSTPVVDGTNITLSNDADGNGVVSKGDTLTFATSYLYSGSNTGPTEFLVLNTNGTDVELLATTNYQTSTFNTSSVTTTDDAGKTVQKYEDSTLDTLLNTTYYNSLSDTVKGKIKSKEITQNTWQKLSDDSGDVDSWYKAGFTASDTSGTTYSVSKTGTVGTYNRNVYALDFQDVVDYLGTSFTPQDLNTMFFGTSENVRKYAWLRSANFDHFSLAFYVNGNSGCLNNNYFYSNTYDNYYEVRPAFTITLN